MLTKVNLIAIDPGHREFGMAHFVGSQLTDFGVKSLRRPRRTNYAVLKEVMVRMVVEKKPDVIAIELNAFAGIGAGCAVLSVTRRMQAIALRHGVPVFGFAANTVKKTLCGDGQATKRTIAKVVTAQFPELRVYFRSDRRWTERYYRNMFDAVAVGLTYLAFAEERKLSYYDISQKEIDQ
jgi:Holliday junction resolvasome RuvABC endonuclease subunit